MLESRVDALCFLLRAGILVLPLIERAHSFNLSCIDDESFPRKLRKNSPISNGKLKAP
jgi:hypothetical protein